MRRQRVRELGIAIGRYPTGPHNALTDVQGIKVGHESVVYGDRNAPQIDPVVRSGVTVIMPNEDIYNRRVFAGSHVINGAGEVTGLVQIQEWGMLETPIALTGSMNVGLVADGIVQYMLDKYPAMAPAGDVVLPVVGECNDGVLSDPAVRPVKQSHVVSAIHNATAGVVPEGAVGGGTGMMAFQFKGGIGTSSRRVFDGRYTVASLVMSNFGLRRDLRIDGVLVGDALSEGLPDKFAEGSCILVMATDAPLFPHQLNRLAKRASFALARTGSYAQNGSGEIAIAFSTAQTFPQDGVTAQMSGGNPTIHGELSMLQDDALSSLFEAGADCTEEAILNSLFMAETVQGRTGTVQALPIQSVLDVLRLRGYRFQ